MPIAFVQSASAAGNSKAFTSNNTAGNLIIVATQQQSVTTFTCADTQLNTYQSIPLVTNDNGSVVAQIFYALNIKSGANTVTISATANTIAIHEFSGINTKDGSVSATGAGNSQDSGGFTTSFSNELLFGFEAANTLGGQATVTKDAAFTLAEVAATSFLTQYRIVSSTGTYHSTTTTTTGKGGTVHWIEQLITFYLAPVRKTSIIDFGPK